MRSLALLLACASLACATSAREGPDAASESVPTLVGLELGARRGIESRPSEPPPRIEIARLYRPLFEEGRGLVYRVSDDADPHDPEGGRVVTETLLDCRIQDVAWQATAVSSTLTCKTRGDEEASVLPTSDWSFLVTPEGLSMSPTPFVMGTSDPPPILPAEPVTTRTGRDTPASLSFSAERCVELVEVGARATCSDVRRDVTQGYGATRDRRCFSPDRGMETLLRENMEGPRVVKWTLVSVKAREPVTR